MEPWPVPGGLRVRAAVHTGEAELRDGDYYGTTVNRCARLRAIAHPGQVICSLATQALVADSLNDGTTLRDLGSHRLRDLSRAERVFQICGADLESEFPPVLSIDALRTNLPAQRTSFVGRAVELATIRRHVSNNRLVTLTGVGGSGKTRLALQVGAELLDDFPDGAFFVDLAPISDPNLIPTAALQALGLAYSGAAMSGRSPNEELSDTVGQRQLLVVLDNCEHLVDSCAAFADALLERCPRVKVLATSREALQIDGEQTFTVPPLRIDTSDVESSDAVRLFCERAALVRESFSFSASAEHVAEICRRLDGIPLAIELAAAQVAQLSASEIAERLDDRFRLLTGGRRRIQRQNTLAAALDWSYELLTDEERTLLRRLAVFPGSFGLEAVGPACGYDMDRPVDLLRALVAKSLVSTEEGEDLRYRLLESIRLYADQKLVAADEAQRVCSAHRDHFMRWIETFDEANMSDADRSRVLAEGHNLRSALVWSEKQEQLGDVARMARRLIVLWGDEGFEEGSRWLDLCLESTDQLEPEVLSEVLSSRAWLAVNGSDLGAAAFAQRVVDLASERTRSLVGEAHSILALMKSFEGVLFGIDVSKEVEESIALALDLLDDDNRNDVLMTAGLARINTGNIEGAIELLERARRAAEEASGELVGSGALSVLMHITGSKELALERAEGRPLSTAHGHVRPLHTGSSWSFYYSLPKAVAFAALGRVDEAHSIIREGVEDQSSFTVPGVAGGTVVALAALAAMQGKVERASTLLTVARKSFDDGIVRSPQDIALYSHYVNKIRPSLTKDQRTRCRELGRSMSLDDAMVFGLRA